MTYKLNPEASVFLLPSKEVYELPVPIWRLADWSIQVGNFKNGYELEELAIASAGSYTYAWIADAVDTMLFSPVSQMLHTLVLNVPESIYLTEMSVSLYNISHRKEAVRLSMSKKFKLNACHLSPYSWTDDNLLLSVKDQMVSGNTVMMLLLRLQQNSLCYLNQILM
jgi:hypothetical protein